MNRILVVHRDRSALDRLEKLLLDRADYQITLADGFRQAVVDGNPNLLETITSHVVQKTIEEALRHTGATARRRRVCSACPDRPCWPKFANTESGDS